MNLLTSRYVIFTLDSINALHDMFEVRTRKYYSNKKVKPNAVKENPLDKYEFNFDPSNKLFLKTKILQGVFTNLNKLNDKGDNPSVGLSKKPTKHMKLLENKRKKLGEKKTEMENLKKEKEAEKKLQDEKKASAAAAKKLKDKEEGNKDKSEQTEKKPKKDKNAKNTPENLESTEKANDQEVKKSKKEKKEKTINITPDSKI
jgi:hypothetical protein